MSSTSETPANQKLTLNQILEDPENAIVETDNVWSRLWRCILFDKKLTSGQFSRLLDRYVQDQSTLKNNSQTPRGTQSIKGNAVRTLAYSKMTWGNFLEGITILRFQKIRLEVHLTDRKGTHVYGINVHNDQLNADETESDPNSS